MAWALFFFLFHCHGSFFFWNGWRPRLYFHIEMRTLANGTVAQILLNNRKRYYIQKLNENFRPLAFKFDLLGRILICKMSKVLDQVFHGKQCFILWPLMAKIGHFFKKSFGISWLIFASKFFLTLSLVESWCKKRVFLPLLEEFCYLRLFWKTSVGYFFKIRSNLIIYNGSAPVNNIEDLVSFEGRKINSQYSKL